MAPPLVRRCECGGEIRIAREVTAEEEAEANRYRDAAILECWTCRKRVVLDAPRRLPPALAHLHHEPDNKGDTFT